MMGMREKRKEGGEYMHGGGTRNEILCIRFSYQHSYSTRKIWQR